MELVDAAIERLLDTWPVARLATVTPGGRPHVVPVVFARVGPRIFSPVDSKPKRGGELARVRHVRADPRVALLLDRYDADWQLLWWLRLDGRAEVVERAESLAVAALRAKYPQYAGVPVLREPPVLLAIDVLSRRSWRAGPLS